MALGHWALGITWSQGGIGIGIGERKHLEIRVILAVPLVGFRATDRMGAKVGVEE